jgi:hypothetical protein
MNYSLTSMTSVYYLSRLIDKVRNHSNYCAQWPFIEICKRYWAVMCLDHNTVVA